MFAGHPLGWTFENQALGQTGMMISNRILEENSGKNVREGEVGGSWRQLESLKSSGDEGRSPEGGGTHTCQVCADGDSRSDLNRKK